MQTKGKGLRKRDRKSDKADKSGRKGARKDQVVEVFVLEPGEGRPPFTFEPGALEFLPADAPLPQRGDIILLPRKVTGDTKAQTFAWGGMVAPFIVVEREHLYFRDDDEKFDRSDPTPAHHVRSLVLVRRMSKEEYSADPATRLAVPAPAPKAARKPRTPSRSS